MGRHTFDSYFWVFQMSTILHAFGVQLWNLAALLHALSRHICIRSMDAHVSFYHWFLSFFSIAGPVVSCGNSRPCGERVDRTQRQIYYKHLNWLWHSQNDNKRKGKEMHWCVICWWTCRRWRCDTIEGQGLVNCVLFSILFNFVVWPATALY